MFDDPTFLIDANDIDAGVVVIARPVLMAMEDHMMPLGDNPLEGHALLWAVGGHAGEVVDKSIFAVGNMWIVLGVDSPDISIGGLARLALIEHQSIEGHSLRLVRFEAIRPR